jgi:hypothetical protein
MREILTQDAVDYIKHRRKTYQGLFIRKENDIYWTYNNCFLVRKKDCSEALFFVISAAREKIALQKWDIFMYTDTKESIYVDTPTNVITYISQD